MKEKKTMRLDPNEIKPVKKYVIKLDKTIVRLQFFMR